MEKQVVQKRWKLIFWGLTAAAVALLAPGLVLTLEPALFLGLGVLSLDLYFLHDFFSSLIYDFFRHFHKISPFLHVLLNPFNVIILFL